MNSSRLRIIVLGYIVRGPMGGMAWHHLQYVMGLRDLGHDVYYVEDSGDTAWSCYDPSRETTDSDPTYGLRFADDAFSRNGLGDRWAYYDAHTGHWMGPAGDCILAKCHDADLLLNLSCANPLRAWLREIPLRVLVDTDPAFTQIRNLTDPTRRSRTEQHNRFFSFGENIGRNGCLIPDDGFPWQPTRQPVVLDAWPVTPPPAGGHFTTVMQWESYPAREYNGLRYGMKSESFQPFLDLPVRVKAGLEIASGGTAPREQLRDAGWSVRNSMEIARDPWTYRQYIRESKGEFSVAKHGYVVSRSGWFSERTAAYLASGRPAIVQDTGFPIPTGEGLFAFSSPSEAADAIDRAQSRHAHHSKAARALAEEHFDAGQVLTDLIEWTEGSSGGEKWPVSRG